MKRTLKCDKAGEAKNLNEFEIYNPSNIYSPRLVSSIVNDYVYRCDHLGRLEELEKGQLKASRKIFDLERELSRCRSITHEQCLLKGIGKARYLNRENIELRRKVQLLTGDHTENNQSIESLHNIIFVLKQKINKYKQLQEFEELTQLNPIEIKRRLRMYENVAQTLDDMRRTLDVSEQSLIVVRSRLDKTQKDLSIVEQERDQARDALQTLENAFDVLHESIIRPEGETHDFSSNCVAEVLYKIRREISKIREQRQQMIELRKQYRQVISRADNTCPISITRDQHDKCTQTCSEFKASDPLIPDRIQDWAQLILDTIKLRNAQWKRMTHDLIGEQFNNKQLDSESEDWDKVLNFIRNNKM